ncbi:MAG: molybdopterin-dependent oxidoreductase [Deltaproteobacteria bacterium]|nr:molybdopterin-dependent oxidoreductase [Deltaproteobacteria bacterium]
MNKKLTRRGFLQATGSTAALLLINLQACGDDERPVETDGPAATAVPPGVDYHGFEDLYRKKWTWDQVTTGTHYSNCGYQRCAWNVYVKDNVVWREEQLATYEQTNADVPDFNPRGCQKGACYSDRMYDKSRLTVPLKRIGNRGDGKWKRIGWDQALSEIADKFIDTMISEKDGPGSIYWDLGSASSNGCHAVGLTRTGYLLDTPILENTSEMGDHAPGVTTTTGKIIFTSSMDDLLYSDLILIWGGNPNYTHIPSALFINEARYKGAHVVTIAPDFSPSALHADEWVPVNIGTDAALALSMAQVIVEEKLYKSDFMAEQTDMPLLVRLDNEEFLRKSDMSKEGDDDVFYVFDTAKNRIVEAPKRSLELDELKPALEGVFEVETRDGTVKVTTVFERVKLQLEDYTPEETEKITGADATNVRNLARRIGNAKACQNITQTNFSKFYHGMEMERSILLVFALAGHFGRRGAGYNTVPMLSISGSDPFNLASGKFSPKIGIGLMTAKTAPDIIRMKLAGYSTEMMLYHFAREDYARGNTVTTALLYYQHCGLKERLGSAHRWDPHLDREFDDYLKEAVEKGWQFVPKTAPRVLFNVGGNMFRRARGYHVLIEHMLPRLDLMVTVDWRMSNTARYSDYVLPAAGYYEKNDIAWGSGIAPFSHPTVKAIEPVGDSKSDWEFHCLLLKKIQERSIARGVSTFLDRHGEERRLDECYDDFTFQRRFTEDNPEDLLQEMLDVTSNLNGASWQDLVDKGFERFTGVGTGVVHIGNSGDIAADETLVANSWHVQKKIPWPTLTRRLQFYIDHPFHQEMGEVLPVHKDNPAIGGDYPLQMTGGHNRWSIHAAWRDHKPLLRLQRGVPVIYVNSDDAEKREIRDGDQVRVHNDLGDFEIQAMVSPALKPGQVVVYHAWEEFQFKDGKTYQALTPSPLNPIQLSGGYFHLQPMVMSQSPGCTDRGTRVDLERV